MPTESQSARAVAAAAPAETLEMDSTRPNGADGAPERTDSVTVSIMQREYTVACSPEERRGVAAAAAHLDQQMRAINRNGRGPGHDRCAIVAGLNISHELLELRERAAEQQAAQARLARLHQRIDDAIADLRRIQSAADADSDSN